MEKTMPLDSADLADLKSRCLFAQAHGYEVARSEHYVSALAEEAGEDVSADVAAFSPSHLLALIDKVEKVRSGEAPKAKKAEPVVEAPKTKKGKAEKAKAEKVEPKVEPKTEPKPEVTETHESLDVFEALVAESEKSES
jgi:hypothetical protein